MNNTLTIRHGGREYYVNEVHGLHCVSYRNINKATGAAWQGIKRDAKLTGPQSVTISADWGKLTVVGYASAADAVAAIQSR